MPPSRNRSKGSRFPGARIKRIMQMDEEVGKLSASVPHMISKSLERFMQSLLEEGTKEARSRGSKKVTPNHLKTAIQSNPNFDFLLEKVAGIPDTGVEKETDNKAGPSKSRAGYVRPSRRKKTEGELVQVWPLQTWYDTKRGCSVRKESSSLGISNSIKELLLYIHNAHGYERDQKKRREVKKEEQRELNWEGWKGKGERKKEFVQVLIIDSKPDDTKPIPDSQPAGLPQLGTWKRDMEGTGGSGEGGRGMFDDYEEDEDDY
ncbi:hypothetical protein M231_02511 [Tremella mesenterica]|uniref:Transcription factor CBF/NF-Y/archaeal histone domain-containing protein n=1 Tax=Tremella mesenterica TaxID=5217 RepID=A0A4V1M4G0_TREME|nr:hypothetical protein M231_02511 [Tremella mesenterica]